MKKFIILPDITCDLSEQIRDFFGLEDYIRGHVHINDDSFSTTLDWSQIERDAFYKALSDKKSTVSSAAASPEEYYQAFRKYAEDGYDILSMSISSSISGTYGIATSAAERIRQDYPECNIYCLDTRRMSGSFGLLVAYACELRSQGKTFEQVIEWLEQNKVRVHQMGPIDDLTVVARRGQISVSKAVMGNLVGIKPMGDCNNDGYVSVLAKAKGIKRALNATVAYLKEMAIDPEQQYIFIMHSNREKFALTLKELVESTVSCKKVFVSDVFSGCGTNIGAGMVSLYFLGQPITEDMSKEKQTLERALCDK